jgi:endonuclease G, mitochondrial
MHYYNKIFMLLLFSSFLYCQTELPKTNKKEQVVYHSGFTLSYNEIHEQASWVAYELTAEELIKKVNRSNNFKIDPKIKTGSALPSDYSRSGYDRGHLAPAADLSWSQTTMRESFYMSNMSPQKPGFNRGIWKKLESYVRQWAYENKSIYVVTGGILSTVKTSIGESNVGIPLYYYKVILDYTQPEIKGIGFILPNTSNSKPLQNFAVSIDEVERRTGIDFFYNLPDIDEQKIESTFNVSSWTFKGYTGSSNSIMSPLNLGDPLKNSLNQMFPKKVTKQCLGLTKKGLRCRNKTSNSGGYCHIHD